MQMQCQPCRYICQSSDEERRRVEHEVAGWVGTGTVQGASEVCMRQWCCQVAGCHERMEVERGGHNMVAR